MCTDTCKMILEHAPGAKPLVCIGLNCLEFSQPLSCLYQAMQTRKTFSTKQNETKTNKANGSKQRSFMSAYFSLGAAGGSRKIQSQEPIKSKGEKLARTENRRSPILSFSPCTIFKTRSCLHNLNSTLSFLVLCARKRLLRRLGTG